MPRIPTGSERKVFERVSSTRGLSARLADTTSQARLPAEIFRSLADINETIASEKIKAEDVQLAEYNTKLRDKKTELIHDKDKGFLRERGKNAVMNEKTYFDQYTKYQSELMDEYKGVSERLKQRMVQSNAQFNSELKNVYTQHTAREFENHQDSVFNGEMDSLQREALLDKSKIGDNLLRQKNLIKKYGDRKGISKKQQDQIYLKASTKLHTQAISDYVNNDEAEKAQDYFDIVVEKKEIDPLEVEKIQSLIKKASLDGQSQKAAAAIILDNPEDNLEQLKAKARDKFANKPELQDLTIKRIDNRIKQQRAEKQYLDNTYYESLGDKLMQDPANFKLTADDYKRLSFSQQKTLLNMKQDFLMQKYNKPKRKSSDMKKYQELMFMPYDKFVSTDLLKYEKDLTTQDLQMFMKMKKDQMEHTNITTAAKYVSTAIKDLDDEQAKEYMDIFEQELNNYPKDKRYSREVLQEVNDKLMMDMRRPGFFNFAKPYYQSKARNLDVTAPKKRPAGLPESAKYIDTYINGKRITGYEHFNSETGTSIIYDFKGRELYRKQKKKR